MTTDDDRPVLLAQQVAVGAYPEGVAVDPERHTAYVCNFHDGTISVVDGVTYRVDTVPIGKPTYQVVVDPTRGAAYVSAWKDQTLWVLSRDTRRVVATVSLEFYSGRLGHDPGSGRLYVPHPLRRTVSVIDGPSGSVVATLPGGPHPEMIAVHPRTKDVYSVSVGLPGKISLISGSTQRLTVTEPVGAGPSAIALDPFHPCGRTVVYVVNAFDDTVSVLDGADLTPIQTIRVGTRPRGIAVPNRRLGH